MTLEIEVVQNPARACAAMLLGAAAGEGHVVLTGGSTPRSAYQELVKAVRAVDVDLTETTFWFGDERCVAPDDERSNYLMAKTALLDPLGEENQPRVMRMMGELGPTEAAERYQRQLQQDGPREFDLVLLGMGHDGHLASLFPDQPALHERSRSVVGVEQARLEPYVPRVTMTLPRLAAARAVLFLITGAEKAAAVSAAFGPKAKPDPHVPASLLPPMTEHVTVLLDDAAAQQL
jgi:6-phosphogluconolactonase